MAFLAAPEVVLQVVVQSRPVSEVRVEIERESVRESTDDGGRCIMMLRPGRHVLRLLHKGQIVHSLEQEVVVTQSRPCIVVSLPITLRTWRAPTIFGERHRAYRVWLTVGGSRGNDSWEPCGMVLQLHDGKRVTSSRVELITLPLEAMQPTTVMVPPRGAPDLYTSLCLPPPLVREVDLSEIRDPQLSDGV